MERVMRETIPRWRPARSRRSLVSTSCMLLATLLAACSSHATHEPSTGPPPLTAGTYYGYVKSLDKKSRAIKFDKVEYYQDLTPGDGMAEKLCRKNGVTVPPDGELCHDYYLKDDRMEVNGTVSNSAKITYFKRPGSPSGLLGTFKVSLPQLAQIAATPSEGGLFEFIVKDGQIVTVSGIYMP